MRKTDKASVFFFAKKRKSFLAGEGRKGPGRGKSQLKGGGEFTPDEQKVWL